MVTKYPLQYAIEPRQVEAGRRWVTVRLKNVGETTLRSLDVRLNSLDAYAIAVYGTGSFVPELNPNEEQILPFQVSANAPGSVYISVDGWEEERPFHWETPGVAVNVGARVAELVSLFAMGEPYVALGEAVRCEAMVHSFEETEDLTLEFWVESADGEFQGVNTLETAQLEPGARERYQTKVMPKEEGIHTLHAYLYDGVRRLGHQTDRVYVEGV
jgi:hypothetical protein